MDNETIEDIVSEMREYDNEPPPKRAWLDLADRIEAAWKRDKSDAIKAAMMCKCEICKELQGNKATMREALELCVHYMCDYCRKEAAFSMPGKRCMDGCETLRIAKDALDAPVRNCDRLATAGEADNLRRFHNTGDRDKALLREAREAIGEGKE